jgi:SAM-dependent methyltransferase
MDPAKIVPSFCRLPPSNQTAVDVLSGHWVSSFPPETGISGDGIPHFDPAVDTRVALVSSVFDLRGKSILELGPLEAYQTKHLFDAGAEVTAIEANDISYLKCLVVKEIFGLHARFLHGDFTEFLNASDEMFDVIWASGILYHHMDPLHLLRLMCARSSALFVWTHYWSKDHAVAAEFDDAQDATRSIDGFSARYHTRGYGGKKLSGFSGGLDAQAVWMERDEILGFVKRHGFKILVESNSPDAPPGPAMLFFASRSS